MPAAHRGRAVQTFVEAELEVEGVVAERERFEPHLALDEDVTIYTVSGRSERDLFLNTSAGLAHSNGNDIEYLLEIPEDVPAAMTRSHILDGDVFFLVADWSVNRGTIYHGSLP